MIWTGSFLWNDMISGLGGKNFFKVHNAKAHCHNLYGLSKSSSKCEWSSQLLKTAHLPHMLLNILFHRARKGTAYVLLKMFT